MAGFGGGQAELGACRTVELSKKHSAVCTLHSKNSKRGVVAMALGTYLSGYCASRLNYNPSQRVDWARPVENN